MSFLKSFNDWLFEKKGDTYKYGCAMISFDFPELSKIQEEIGEMNLYTESGDRSYGFEDEPHTTLLFGLHEDVDDNDVFERCKGYDFSNIKLHNPSLFKNEKFDVLKFDAECDGLYECNAALSELPHTTDYPDYHPHATIAYLKKGTGDKIVEKLKAGETKEFNVKGSHIVYSKPDGSKLKRKI